MNKTKGVFDTTIVGQRIHSAQKAKTLANCNKIAFYTYPRMNDYKLFFLQNPNWLNRNLHKQKIIYILPSSK